MPLAAVRSQARPMSGAEFRSFQEKRPDHERWELIGGLPVMMTPPFMEHNRIASNLENLLNAALREHDATRMAVQRPGIECEWPDAVVTQLGKRGDYRPEPDVAVVSYDDVVAGKRFTAAGFLLAEVVSSTDEETARVGGERWVDVKVRLYQSHAPCEAVVLIEQDRVHLTVLTREEEGWIRQDLKDLDDPIAIPSMGLSCTVGDIYADTRWQPRAVPGHTP
ncbi:MULTISPECIES: Uma2 family endonuclease [Bacteria]|uniref:Uma2 family endonuclease n=1 Tax=Bacteria TaxID=2 RepID=UPI00332D12BA